MKALKNSRTARPTKNKRSSLERVQDLADIARMLREGRTHQEMSDWIRLNRPYTLSRTQITYDIATLMRNWRARATETMGDMIAKQLAAIDAQEAEAWKAWHKSIGEMTEVQQEQIEGAASTDGKRRTRAVVRKWISHGDPRYLHIVSDCVEARNRLLGLTKHRLELSGPDNGPLKVDTTEKDFDMEHIDAFLARHYAERGKNSQANKAGVPDGGGAATSTSE